MHICTHNATKFLLSEFRTFIHFLSLLRTLNVVCFCIKSKDHNHLFFSKRFFLYFRKQLGFPAKLLSNIIRIFFLFLNFAPFFLTSYNSELSVKHLNGFALKMSCGHRNKKQFISLKVLSLITR